MTSKNSKLKILLLILSTIVLVGVLYSFKQAPTDDRELVVLSYSSFNSLLGPGKDLKPVFEKSCGCRLKIINGGEAALLLKKLKYLEQVDVVVGLDQFLLDRAEIDYKWEPLSADTKKIVLNLQPMISKYFVPFDWSPMTFIFRQSVHGDSLGSLSDLTGVSRLSLPKSISLQDPRTSTPGLHLLWWVSAQEDPKEFLRQFKPLIHSISPSWSSSYGLFQQRQVSITFSYLTSLLYHWGIESDLDYHAFENHQGHPYQVEFVGIPSACKNCSKAQEFVEFLISETAQEVLREKNYMFPAIQTKKNEALQQKLPKLKLLSAESLIQFRNNLDKYLNMWDEVLLD